MNWLSIAADFLRDAMGSSSEPAEAAEKAPPPTNIAEVTELLNRHRYEIDKNFETVVAMLNAQKARHLEAMQLQKRWNYGLAAGLLILGLALAVVIYWFRPV
jgi:hypothetical protein